MLRARLCCQININAGFAAAQPIRNSLSSEENTGVFMWIELRNFSVEFVRREGSRQTQKWALIIGLKFDTVLGAAVSEFGLCQ